MRNMLCTLTNTKFKIDDHSEGAICVKPFKV